MNGMRASTEARPRSGLLRAGILGLGIIISLIHISLLFPDLLFILNGLGYVGLLAAYFLPVPLFQRYHHLVRWALIGYTAITILAWVAIGEKSWPEGALGYITKVLEVGLIALLLSDRPRTG